MLETLFTYPAVLARHQMGPGSAERGRYLAHCAAQGLARETLLHIARELLVVAERLDVTAGQQITRLEIEAAAGKWVRHQRRRRRGGRGEWSRQLFIQIAADWLRFLELLAVSPAGRLIHSDQIDDFIAHLSDERGLSPRTVSHRRWQVERFLRHISPPKRRSRTSPSTMLMLFSIPEVETAGVAYRSQRVRQRCARSFDMLRCEGGVLLELPLPSTRHGSSNRMASQEVLAGLTCSGSWKAPSARVLAIRVTTQS
jgi:hypothetical protein